jgi:hypothetical protein
MTVPSTERNSIQEPLSETFIANMPQLPLFVKKFLARYFGWILLLSVVWFGVEFVQLTIGSLAALNYITNFSLLSFIFIPLGWQIIFGWGCMLLILLLLYVGIPAIHPILMRQRKGFDSLIRFAASVIPYSILNAVYHYNAKTVVFDIIGGIAFSLTIIYFCYQIRDNLI